MVLPALLILSFFAKSAWALQPYWTTDADKAKTSPPGDGWTAGNPPQTLGANEMDVWIAFPNDPGPEREKFFRVVIDCSLGNAFQPLEVEAFETADDSQPVRAEDLGSTGNALHYDGWWAFQPQPAWERIKLPRSTGGVFGPITWSVEANSMCSDAAWELPELKLRLTSFGAPGAMSGSPQWTEVWVFPRDGSVDTAMPPVFNAPPSTGVWGSTIVYTDPNGTARPGGGLKFTSSGPGLSVNDRFDAEIWMNAGSGLYDDYVVFSWDASALEYQQYRVNTAVFVVPVAGWALALSAAALALAGAILLRRPHRVA